MKTRALSFVLAALASLAIVPGCSTEVADQTSVGEDDVTMRSAYEISFPEYNGIFRGSFANAEEAFRVLVKVGDKTIPAPTHLFGEEVNVIPYSNADNVRTADGRVLERGDSVIARVFKPGQIGIALKHHRSAFPVLDINDADPTQMKEHFKLQDAHVGIVVGVEREGRPGAITINNPQKYEDGLWGDEVYAMVFLRAVYPSYLDAAKQKAFEDNVRTMLVGFNAVTDFPGNYNGGDPLGARDPERVREYVKMMVLALNGDEAARAWFRDPDNQVYCSELAFLAYTAGLHVPLNEATMIPLVGRAEWEKFNGYIEEHDRGGDTPFTALNENARVGLIRDLTTAPPDLRPAPSYGPAGEENKLALQPLTMSDILEEFIRTHLPRELIGEALAPAQGAVLAAMKPGLIDQMGMTDLPASDPRRAAVDALYDKVVAAVSQSYGGYDEFRAALEPLLAQARAATGPRGDSGVGLFVPPSLFHVAAQGKRTGLLSFQYEGHGVHASAVKRRARPAADPTPVSRIASDVSCENQCGGMAVGGCYCDARCATNSAGCCADFASVCR
jgi:hypothetical protein